MASFLAGPAAHLLGAGMQAVGVGIPVGETSAKVINGLRGVGVPVPPDSWFKRKDKRSAEKQHQPLEQTEKTPKKNLYDKLESHINGVIQVVKPAIELQKMVRENCCKSADRPNRATNQSSKETLKYYTPQKRSCGSYDSPGAKKSKSTMKKSPNDGKCKRRTHSSSTDEEDSCLSCSSKSKPLRELPCRRFICSKCDEYGFHELECKQCKKLMS